MKSTRLFITPFPDNLILNFHPLITFGMRKNEISLLSLFHDFRLFRGLKNSKIGTTERAEEERRKKPV
jgi:hypothetical protein